MSRWKLWRPLGVSWAISVGVAGAAFAAGDPPKEAPAAEKPAGDKPAEEKPAGDKPEGEKPAGEKPAEKPAKSDAKEKASVPVIETLAHGQVDWTSKLIRVTGSGAPNAKLPNVAAIRLNSERTAKLAAYRNIIEALKGVRIEGDLDASDRLGQSLVRGQVEGIVQGCKAVDTRYFSDGGVDVEVECALDGALAYAIAPPKDFQALPEGGDKKYTGLIVEVTGSPGLALAPRLMSGTTVVYSQEMVKTKFLRKHGPAAYFRSTADAKSRAGSDPLVIKGQAVLGSADVAIGSDDAAKIGGLNRGFLGEGRVAIVVTAP